MDAALRLGGGHALHAVAARLKAQLAVNAHAHRVGRPVYAQHHFLVAAQFAGRFADDLDLPAVALGKTDVQAKQIAGEQRRLVAARAGADLDEGGARVIRVLGNQHQLQGLVELRNVGLGGGNFLFGHGRHLGVFLRLSQHLLGAGQVGLATGQPGVLLGDDAGLGMFPGQGAKARQVADHVGGGQQRVQLMQPQKLAVQGLAEKGFHWIGAAKGKIRKAYRRDRQQHGNRSQRPQQR